MKSTLRIAAAGIAALAFSGWACAQSLEVTGAGASFPAPLYAKWAADYNKATGVKVNYQSIGSGGGILQLTNKTVDFGATDGPLNEEQTKKMAAPALHIPMASGAVVITYNLPGDNNNINLTPDIIADIYLGKIKQWNDARIASINKGVSIPAFPILVAHRSDGSGANRAVRIRG